MSPKVLYLLLAIYTGGDPELPAASSGQLFSDPQACMKAKEVWSINLGGKFAVMCVGFPCVDKLDGKHVACRYLYNSTARPL